MRLIITPDETILVHDENTPPEMLHPDTISIVLDDGEMFSIHELVELIKKKRKIKKEGKIKQFRRAFNKAMKEIEEEPTNG